MIKKVFFLVCFLLINFTSFAQSPEEKRNRIVFNRIEYFFNIQQMDSIYALGSDDFKTNIPYSQIENILGYFSSFGKISNADLVTYREGIAGYNITIGNNQASLYLGIDSNFRYNYFTISDKPIQVKTTPVKSVVKKESSLDNFVDSIARTYIQSPNTQALAIGIVHKNKVNKFFYGETIKGDSTSLPNENTLFEIASLTKLFTANLLAELVENQVISLEDSIAKFLPDSVAQNPEIQKITFKQLANHTSGLPLLPDNISKVANFSEQNPYANYTRTDLFQALKSIKLNAEPGEKYVYSNLGFGLLGELISIISKKTYMQNIQSQITTPLGLINTTDKVNPKTQQLAKVYNAAGNEVPTWDFQALAGLGALKSTINDLLRYAQYQFKMPETPLENAMALTRQFTFYLPPNTDIGLGWHMRMTDDVITYWHAGGTAGSSSFLGLAPDEKTAVVILSNSAISVDEISAKILEKLIKSK